MNNNYIMASSFISQSQLVKSEWDAIDVPVSEEEIRILRLICTSFSNVNFREGKITSLLGFLKIDANESMHGYLFKTYLAESVEKLRKLYGDIFKVDTISQTTIKKADSIRIQHTNIERISEVAEFILLGIIEKIFSLKTEENSEWGIQYYTLRKISQNTIYNLNPHFRVILDKILNTLEEEINIQDIIANSVEFIEKNTLLLKYADVQLYEHQKQLFSVFNGPESTSDEEEMPAIIPKLILYTAPTGTGKTMSPIGLSEKYRVIFVCAAKHVGIALAKSAVSIGKKIAFAFGCSCAADIRLHFNAATEFTRDAETGKLRKIENFKHKKSGKYAKIDNSIGDKVEIMICDINSYIPAMLYMRAFHPLHKLLTFWDEPTISMDYETHELHAVIKRNWNENVVPTVILSSATLPKIHELRDTMADFDRKFPGARPICISSHECKKSIPILNKNGETVIPHTISSDYAEFQSIATHCESNFSLLRYFDLRKVVEFIMFMDKSEFIPSRCRIDRCFASIDDINMMSVKLHYIKVLKNIREEHWPVIYEKFSGGGGKAGGGGGGGAAAAGTYGVLVSTKDAYTLTDGPTLFLANDVEKIALFCIQQAKLPAKITDMIFEKIKYNNGINDKISHLEEDMQAVIDKNSNKEICSDTSITATKAGGGSKKKDAFYAKPSEDRLTEKFISEIDVLRGKIVNAELDEMFIPNKPAHLKRWHADEDWIRHVGKSFTSTLDEETVIAIMMLTNVPDNWKLLLLMGIGVFTNHKSVDYTEIMKKLADSQQLFMIIASSDYIYGTNYQFCHLYLSKDLALTQEKIIQAVGRIGRNNIQQTYSIRLRDDEQIKKLFYEEENKIEVRLMNQLFSSN